MEWRAWKVRCGAELCVLPQFVQPNSPSVLKILNGRKAITEQESILNCYDYVCRNISYPLTWDGRATDYHKISAFPIHRGVFGTSYRVSETTEEFFQYPGETLTWGFGDCEDTSTLLTSLLRNFLPPDRVFCVIGNYQRFGHAWVQVKLKDGNLAILETTLSSAPPNPWRYGGPYSPYIIFNDLIYLEMGPMGDRTRKFEAHKLREIRSLWQHPVKGLC